MISSVLNSEHTIALAGPVETMAFNDLLHEKDLIKAPKGLGGSPVNLLARELIARGYKLILVSLDPSVENEVVLHGEGVKIFFGPFRKKRARDFFAKEIAWIRRTLEKEKPDIVHAHWTYEFASGAISTTIPCLVTAHDAPLNVLRLNFIPYRIARTYMAFRALRGIQHLTAVAPYVATHLNRYFFYRKEIKIIPNGMPATLFENEGVKRAGSPLTFATILVGWSKLKNGQKVIEAFAKVRRERHDARLLMFGSGHGPDEAAQRWAAENHLSEGIEFIGQIAHEELLTRLKHDVDVVVHPALEEAQPMALIESMAMGIPVIAGERAGGVPWTLEKGRLGVLVDVRSEEVIAAAMKELAFNDKERLSLGEKGREGARRRFHISVVTDAYLETYSEVLTMEKKGARVAHTG